MRPRPSRSWFTWIGRSSVRRERTPVRHAPSPDGRPFLPRTPVLTSPRTSRSVAPENARARARICARERRLARLPATRSVASCLYRVRADPGILFQRLASRQWLSRTRFGSPRTGRKPLQTTGCAPVSRQLRRRREVGRTAMTDAREPRSTTGRGQCRSGWPLRQVTLSRTEANWTRIAVRRLGSRKPPRARWGVERPPDRIRAGGELNASGSSGCRSVRDG